MGYKAIIFDLDGTLVDTLADLAGAMNFALEKLDQPTHPKEACRIMIGNGVKTFAQRALGPDKQDLRDELLDIMKNRYSDKCFDKSYLYDGVYDSVKKLRQKGTRLAVVTNKDQADAERVVSHFFGDSFEYVVGITGDNALKPDPAGTLKIVKSMGLGCNNFLFVGDSDVDILTARAAKIRSVGVTWGFRGRNELAKTGADIIIDRPEEILGLA